MADLSLRHRGSRLLVELVVVVVGVMIALAGDSWREQYLEARVANAYETRLHDEVSQNVSAIRSVRARFSAAQRAAGLLTEILESAEPSADPVDRLLEAAAIGLGREELGPQATYQELVASGQLALLPRSVRSEVVAHYDRVEGLWSVLQDLPRLNRYVTRVTGYMPIDFLDHGRALTEADRAKLSEALATDEELARTLREIHADLVFADRRFDETLDGAKALLEALE